MLTLGRPIPMLIYENAGPDTPMRMHSAITLEFTLSFPSFQTETPTNT
jgi:hypothetical protein